MKKSILKRIVCGIILLLLCVSSIWKEMQILAIVSIILFLCIVFKDQTITIYHYCLIIIKQTKQAKFGNVEISVENEKKILALMDKDFGDNFLNTIIPNLTMMQLSLMLTIGTYGNFEFNKQHIETLRELRNYSLISHDNETLSGSKYVYLTKTGDLIYNQLKQQ